MATANEGWKTGGLFKGPGIPAPSGQYQVGCAHLMHKFDDEEQTLLVRLFYPCQSGGQFKYAQWMPHKRYAKGYLEYTKTKHPGFISSIINVLIGPRIPALFGSPLLSGTPAGDEGVNGATVGEGVNTVPPVPMLPVVVFSHGLGAMSNTYSAICCDIASHGYVVASVEHRDRSASVSRIRVPGCKEGEWVDEWLTHYHLGEGEKEFPLRNDQVKKRAVDCKRALDLLGLLNEGSPVGNLLGVNYDFTQFKGRLNLDTVGIMGHSFGGATTIQTLSEDQRFKCGVCLDTWMLPIHKGIYENGSVVQQPIIFINSFDFQWKENIQQMTMMTKPPNEQGISNCRLVTLIGTNHYYQTDLLYVFPKWVSSSPRSALDPVIGHQVNMDISQAFLRRHLLKDPAYQGPIPDLDGSDGHSPHILFGSNVDITPDDPVTTGEDNVTAGEDHVTAGEDHVTTGEDHVTAGDDHVSSPDAEDGKESSNSEEQSKTMSNL